jgi:CBS domain-containing protein
MVLAEVLHAHIPRLGPKASVRDAVDMMDIYQFSGLVITDDDQQVLGVLTEGDICRAVQQQSGLMALASEPAIRFATQEPICARPEMEVSDALHLMLSRGLTLLPVADGPAFLGMVLRVDLMQAMLMDQSEGHKA